MKKIILPALLVLTTGCSSYTSLPEPYETRYFSVTNMLPNNTFDSNFDKKCKDVVESAIWWWTEKSVLVTPWVGVAKFNKDDKYNVIAKSKDNKKRVLRGEVDRLTMPLSTMNKCTIDEKTYKKQKEAEKIAAQKKAAAIAEQKRKAKEAEAAKAAAEKRAAEKEAAGKNNKILTKYGKPLCDPYKAGDSDIGKLYYDVTEKKKNCLFIKNFKISQTVSEGFLAYTTNGWRGQEGPYFIVKNKDDNDVVDDEEILGLFEYIGTYSYDSVMGPKKVLKFKHVK